MTIQRIPRVIWLICVVLLVAAVLRLPYGYYNFLRIVICGAAALIAIAAFRRTLSEAWRGRRHLF
jgi:hypothetical protein